jgi:hypothetical protein
LKKNKKGAAISGRAVKERKTVSPQMGNRHRRAESVRRMPAAGPDEPIYFAAVSEERFFCL